MSFLGGLFGKAAAQPIEAVGNVLDKLFTSDEEKLSKKILLEKLAQAPHIAQIELNKVEAQHRSPFVAGWRPFIGWVCGLALLWHFMLYDIVSFFSETAPPKLAGTEQLISIVMALLGLGAMRSIEKHNGRSK